MVDPTIVSDEEYEQFTQLEPRVCTLDIETDDRSAGFPELGEERILSIVAHDSYEDEVVGFIDLDGRTIEECFPDGCPDGLDQVRCEPTERRMLIAFRSWFQGVDPDLVTGWNADDFDIPFIIERMTKLEGLDENALSPLGWAGHGRSVRIKGRTVYDLLKVYKANSFTELRSYSLDDVAQEVLGAEKIQFDGTFFDLYDENPARFLEYNARDVDLAVRINREADVIQFRDTLRREVGVDFEESYNANSFIEMLCRRKLAEKDVVPPTASYEGDEDYEGAHVFDAYEGVAENVVGIDLASLYPYTMAMLNASPETKITDGVDRAGEPVPAETQTAEAPNGAEFRLDKDGLFKELIDESLSLKKDYKEKRDAAESDEEYEKWAKKYLTAKTITNCFSPDTEVMTPAGVQNIRELSVGDPVYSVNPDTGAMEVKPVTDTHAYPDYDDGLVTIRNSGTDFKVTPNHRMLVSRQTGYVSEDGYSFVEAGDLLNSGGYEMPNKWGVPDGETPDSIDLRDFLSEDEYRTVGEKISEPRQKCGKIDPEIPAPQFIKLIGWYISEGSIYTSTKKEYETTTRGRATSINISQEKDPYRTQIEGLLDSLGLSYYKGDRSFQITGAGVLATVLERLCGSGSENMQIPDAIFNWSPDMKSLLFGVLMAGDGNHRGHRYTTKSEELRDDVMRLLVETGHTPRYNRDSSAWRVHWDVTRQFRAGRDTGTEQAENGVYCVTVADNHTLLAGRNGRFQPVGQSIYGTLGWEYFFLYDKDVAASVTTTGQSVIKRTAECVEAEGHDVLYGDSDSVYIKFNDSWPRGKCLDGARDLCDELNNVVYPELAEDMGVPAEDNLWDIEVEAYMERFFQAGKKKRYAYLTTWKDGRELDNPKISVTGFASRRSDSAALTKETEEAVLEAILHGEQGTVGTMVFEAAQEITSTDVDWDRIGIPGGLNQKIDPARAGEDGYYSFSEDGYPQDAHPRAVWNANKVLDAEIETSDKPKRVYLEPRTFSRVQRKIDVIAFNEASDLSEIEDDLQIDAARMTNVTLIRPLEEILHAIDIDPEAAVRGQQQTGLGAFE